MIFKTILHFYWHSDEYKVGLMNGLALGYSFFEATKVIEKIAQIFLLLVTIVFTIYKIVEIHKRNKKNKDKDD